MGCALGVTQATYSASMVCITCSFFGLCLCGSYFSVCASRMGQHMACVRSSDMQGDAAAFWKTNVTVPFTR